MALCNRSELSSRWCMSKLQVVGIESLESLPRVVAWWLRCSSRLSSVEAAARIPGPRLLEKLYEFLTTVDVEMFRSGYGSRNRDAKAYDVHLEVLFDEILRRRVLW